MATIRISEDHAKNNAGFRELVGSTIDAREFFKIQNRGAKQETPEAETPTEDTAEAPKKPRGKSK